MGNRLGVSSPFRGMHLASHGDSSHDDLRDKGFLLSRPGVRQLWAPNGHSLNCVISSLSFTLSLFPLLPISLPFYILSRALRSGNST